MFGNQNYARPVMIFFTLVFCLFWTFTTKGQGLNLIINGKTEYKIVVPKNGGETIKNAARILENYLFISSSVHFPIIESETYDVKKKSIYIGFGIDTFLKDHGVDGISIVSNTGQSLNISGGSPRAVIYSVYNFLEKYLGYKFWTPAEYSFTKVKNLAIPSVNYNYHPQFEYRTHYNYFALKDKGFSASLKQNGYGQPMGTGWGTPNDIEGLAHTFQKLIPVEKYFEKHPEWFADPNNKYLPCTKRSKRPKNHETQLCLENQQLYNELLNNLFIWISQVKSSRPYVQTFSVSINDNNGYCHCDECLKQVKDYGSPSGSLIRFLNKLIGDVHKKYPKVKINTLAYMSFLPPPHAIDIKDGISVMVAPIRADFGYPLSSSRNKKYAEIIAEWSQLSKEVYYWGYNTNFNNFLMPHPSLYHLQEDLLFLKQRKIRGIFLQDNIYTNGVGFFKKMDSWIAGKLMWNPGLDQKELVSTFCNGYYGSAGVYLERYFYLVTDSFKESNIYLNTFNNDYSFLTESLLATSGDLFDKAIKSVSNDRILLKRVKDEKFAFDFAKFMIVNSAKKRGGERLGNNINVLKSSDITNGIDFYNIKKIALNKDLQTSKNSIDLLASSTNKNTSTANSTNKNTSQTNKFIVQDLDFKLFDINKSTFKIEDKDASDNNAISIYSKSGAWNIQIPMEKVASNNLGKSLIKVYLKIEVSKTKIDSQKSIIEIGAYNTKEKAYRGRKRIDVKGMTFGRYSIQSFTLSDLKKSDIIYISLTDKINQIKRVVVDKLEIEKINDK